MAHLTHGKTLLQVLEQVIAKTDGVPLFVEELIKMVLESGLVDEAEDHYVLTGQLHLGDSCHGSGLSHGPPGSAWHGEQVAQLGATLGRDSPMR